MSKNVFHIFSSRSFLISGASLIAQSIKSLLALQESQVRSLGWEDPLEKEMATLSSILAWEMTWTEELAGCSSWGHKESDMT